MKRQAELNIFCCRLIHSFIDSFIYSLGILQGVYWGLGTGSGTIAGGFLINHVGVRTAFRIGGGVGSVVFVLFVALQCWIARNEKQQQQQQKQQQLRGSRRSP